MTYSTSSTPSDNLNYQGISVREALSILFERKWSVVAIVFATIATTVAMLYFVLSPKYESSSTLLISFTDVVRPVVNAPPKSDFEKVTDFHTQIDILSSTLLAEQVVEDLNLAETRVLSNLEKIKLSVREVRSQLGQWLGIEKWQKPWDAKGAAIAAIERKLSVESSPESKVLEIKYRAFSPVEAKETLEALIKNFEQYYYQRMGREAQGILRYIEQQIEEVSQELALVEQEILAFKQNNIQNNIQQDSRNLSIPQESRKHQSTDLYYSSLNITDSLELQDEYKLYILRMEEELRVLEQNVPANDPKVIALKKKLKHMLNKINSLPEQELKITQLNRKQKIFQDKYLLLATNLNQARLITMGQLDSLNLIETLTAPAANEKPVSPKKRLILAFSVILSFGLAFAWCYLAYFLDHRIRTPRDLEQFIKVRCIASLAEIK